MDRCIPSDLATGTAAEIEEERRLLYVAMTQARDDLVLRQPLRFYVRGQALGADRHVYAPRSRFIADADLEVFELSGMPVRPPAPVDVTCKPSAANVDLMRGCDRCGGSDLRRKACAGRLDVQLHPAADGEHLFDCPVAEERSQR
jgi:hypothetical protein